MELVPLAVSEADGFTDVTGGAGTVLSSVPGQPRLPQQVATYALPPDADLATVSVTVDDLEFAVLPLARPVRPAAPWRTSPAAAPFYGGATNIVDGRDLDVYHADADVPAAAAVREGVLETRLPQRGLVVEQAVAGHASAGEADPEAE